MPRTDSRRVMASTVGEQVAAAARVLAGLRLPYQSSGDRETVSGQVGGDLVGVQEMRVEVDRVAPPGVEMFGLAGGILGIADVEPEQQPTAGPDRPRQLLVRGDPLRGVEMDDRVQRDRTGPLAVDRQLQHRPDLE